MINEEEIKSVRYQTPEKNGICDIYLYYFSRTKELPFLCRRLSYEGTARTTTCVQGTPFTNTRG